MGHDPRVRGPLALAARSAGHDPDVPLAIEFLDAARRRACYDARPRSSMGSPVLWASSSPPAALCRRLNDSEGLFWIGTDVPGEGGRGEGTSQPA